jgi:hypothetical protein
MFICCTWNDFSWKIKTSLGVRVGGARFDMMAEFASPCPLSFGHQTMCFLVDLANSLLACESPSWICSIAASLCWWMA